MKLHRTSGRPDWADLPPGQYNSWQKLAAATSGIITPGNIITTLGLFIVLSAIVALLQKHIWLGLAGLALGRLLDLADGIAADNTGTKSPLGEAMDATVDKIGTGLTLLAVGISGTISWLILGLLAAPHILISIIALIALYRDQKFHPSQLGKLAMATAWVGLLGLIALKGSHESAISGPGILVYAVGLLSVVLGFIAAINYWRQH